MKKQAAQRLFLGTLIAIASCTAAWAQTAPASPQATKESFDRAINAKDNWYFSWGWSRQQYAPSDIHVSQPELGRDFTVHQASATDFPTGFEDTIKSTLNLELTNPQENIRIGKFLNEDKTFAIELNIDHSKYNTDLNQVTNVTGTGSNVPNGPMPLNSQDFYYALHNGLNHIMLNAVWFKHLRGPVQQPGDLQLVSRLGAGILLPHADNTIFGKENQVGPKSQNICCGKGDWWQINGWTAGVEVGLRYTVYKSIYLELTQKIAYGELRDVPVYKGTADQKIWMSEQVLSTGFLF
jgi:hypothetical protein